MADNSVTPVPQSVVRGTVRDAKGHPISSATVEAVDCDLRHKDKSLGSTETDAYGRYEIFYSRDFSRSGKARPNLAVRIVVERQIVARSDICFGAGEAEVLDVAVDVAESEYQRLSQECGALLEGLALSNLKDEELFFAALEMGEEPQSLEVLRQATILAEDLGVSSELLYGLGRSGVPLELDELLSMPPAVWRDAAHQAVDNGLIFDTEATESFFDRLTQMAVDQLARYDGFGLTGLLRSAVPDQEKRREVATLWHEVGRADGEFWQRLAELPEIGEDDIAGLRRRFEVAGVIGASVPLIEAALGRVGEEDPAAIARLRASDWEQLIDESEIALPDDLETDGRRGREAYAELLERSAEVAYPREALVARLPDSAVPHGREIADLLSKRPEVNLASDSPEMLRANVGGEASREQLFQLDALGRLYRMTPRLSHIDPLLREGFDSAYSIASLERRAFAGRLEPDLLPAEAASIHAKAEARVSQSIALFMRYRREANTPHLEVASGQRADALEVDEERAVARGPAAAEWASLFGGDEFCECPDCRSVLSPAAYLVDLLHFLDARGVRGGQLVAPLDRLFELRPDLARLELTCKNTTTLLPMIDLINELCAWSLTGEAVPVASRRTGEELAVEPEWESSFPEAYGALANARFPFGLPYDRPWDELRTHLEQLKLPRWKLINLLRPHARSRASVELLGLPPAEAEYLAPDETAVPGLWGFETDEVVARVLGLPEDDWKIRLPQGPTLLQRTDLSFEQLDEVFNTWFIRRSKGNPHLVRDGCAAKDVRVEHHSIDLFGRLQAFLRLCIRTGWGAFELDALLRGVNAAAITGEVVDALADARWLEDELHVSPHELATWWSDLSTEPQPDGVSAYDAVFQNRARSPIDARLAVANLGGSLDEVQGADPPPVRVAVKAALGLLEGEFAALVQSERRRSLSVPLLSRLYRTVSLARALRIPISELLALKALTGVNPFEAHRPASTRAFVELIRRLPDWGFSAGEVGQLLTGQPRAAGLVPEAAALDGLVATIGSMLAGVKEANKVPDPPPAEPAPGALETRSDQLRRDVDRQRRDAELQKLLERLVAPPQVESLRPFFTGAALANTRANRATVTGLLPELGESQSVLTELLGPGAPASPGTRLSFALYRVAGRRAIVEQLSSALSADATVVKQAIDLVQVLTGDHVRSAVEVLMSHELARPSPSAAATNDARAAVGRVAVTLSVAKRLGVAAEELELICGRGPSTWLDCNRLPIRDGEAAVPFALLQLAAEFFTRSRRRQQSPTSWESVLRAGQQAAGSLRDDSAAEQRQAALTALHRRAASALSTDAATVRVLAAPQALDLDRPVPGDGAVHSPWSDGRALVLVDRALEALAQLGVPADTALSWTDERVATQSAQAAVRALRSRYDAERWPSVERPLRDALRERQRDALVAALIHGHISADELDRARLGFRVEPRPVLEGPDALSERLLIDVQMSGCRDTSRIHAAIASVQAFVQRCLLGGHREPRVQLDAQAEREWRQWMSSYRAWEANRMIFLWPENYCRPELRRHKSHACSEFEQQMGQGELTVEHVEAALTRYVEQLDSVARLKICGLYQERLTNFAGTTERTHVVAHSAADPRTYWYRVREGDRWSGWEPIGLDIAADQVVLAMTNDRLYLCWPTFEEKTEKLPAPGMPDTRTRPPGLPPGQSAPAPPEPKKYVEVGLAYSHREGAGWAPRKIAKGAIRLSSTLPIDRGDPSAKVEERGTDVRLVAEEQRDEAKSRSDRPLDAVELVIRCYQRAEAALAVPLGAFVLGGCHGTFTAEKESADTVLGLVTERFSRRVAPVGEESRHEPLRDEAGLPMPRRGCALLLPTGRNRSRQINVGYIDAPAWPVTLLWPYVRYPYEELLASDQGPFRLVLPQGGQFFAFDGPFVYEDADRRFFARLVERPIAARPDWQGPFLRELVEEARFGNTFDETLRVGNGDGFGLGDAVLADTLYTVRGATTTRWSSPSSHALEPAYRFERFDHPYVCRFLTVLRREGVDGLLRLQQQRPDRHPALDFESQYMPTWLVEGPYPKDVVDFKPDGAYAMYNYELFVYAPLFVAQRLQQDQKFEEAMRWHHFIFNPGAHDLKSLPPRRYWNVLPFYETASSNPVDELRQILTQAADGPAHGLAQLVADWRLHPFDPWQAVWLRRDAVQKAVVMSYLDLLLEWGDSLFRQYTAETLNQATLLYTWAARILGERHERLPEHEPKVETWASLTSRDGPTPRLDAFSNAVARVESLLPANGSQALSASAGALRTLGTALYFCIPPNPVLLQYWNRVDDRLRKIRHCQDIEGVARPVPLVGPRLDPALAGRAAAAGTAVGAIGANAPPSLYRFPIVLARAMELCAEVRGLGAAFLSAYERRDGEYLARLRSGHERALLDAVTAVREHQVQEATHLKEALTKGKMLAEERKRHYTTLLQGEAATEETGPSTDAGGGGLIAAVSGILGLSNAASTLVGGAPSPPVLETVQSISAAERAQIKAMGDAMAKQWESGGLDIVASMLYLLPQLQVGIAGFGGTPSLSASAGGQQLGAVVSARSRQLTMLANWATSAAALSGISAGHKRREQDWQLQEKLASKEIEQYDAQLTAAQDRIDIAHKELDNHKLQISQARQVDEALASKFTSTELYSWMIGQLSTAYFAAYQLALEDARRAERTFQYEHPQLEQSFIGVGAWDSLRKGLLAGERLQADLRRMESAYLSASRRDHELTKHISLAAFRPAALVELRSRGACEFTLPEWLFDADHPGHYLRRIKSVSLTLPAVVGPYTSVNSRLTLRRSAIRYSPDVSTGYGRVAEDEQRFRDYMAPVSSIATSRGQGDAGMFELNFRDERYLPFEMAGAVDSTWVLELDPDCNDFDLHTLADVIIELNYTARDGGAQLRRSAKTALRRVRQEQPQWRLVSARAEFADQWYEFLHPVAESPQVLRIDLGLARFPYRAREEGVRITNLYLAAVPSAAAESSFSPPAAGMNVMLTRPDGRPASEVPINIRRDGSLQALAALPSADVELQPVAVGNPADTWHLALAPGIALPQNLRAPGDGGDGRLSADALEDLFILVKYTLGR